MGLRIGQKFLKDLKVGFVDKDLGQVEEVITQTSRRTVPWVRQERQQRRLDTSHSTSYSLK